MNDMIEVKTAELIGPALDWAVSEAIGEKNTISSRFIDNEKGDATLVFWCWDAYSTDWGTGGPLIEKYLCRVVIQPPYWEACALRSDKPWVYGLGETVLIAACRAIVADKLGETVQVPKELVQ